MRTKELNIFMRGMKEGLQRKSCQNPSLRVLKLTLSQKIKKMCSSFAAKEALVKALGTGFRGIYPPDISVIKNNLGKPDLFFNNSANFNVHLSITNTARYTLSFIVLEK